MENRKYCFRGNGIDAAEFFYEVYDSEKEAIAAAKNEYDNGEAEHLGYLSENEDDETLNPIVTICRVEDFDIARSVKNGIESFKDYILSDYYDFESGIDDAEADFKKGFNEEMFNAIMPIMNKYFEILGISQIGLDIYDVDLSKIEE